MNNFKKNAISGSVFRSCLLILLVTISSDFVLAQESGVAWREALNQEESWYGSKEAQRIADNVILFQNNNGGWLKNIDMADELSPSQITKLKREKTRPSGTTIDNDATHTQMRFMAMVYKSTGKNEYKNSFLKGVDYLLDAQYENGGWPQFYPLRGGYYDHITFNDGAMIGVMQLLRDIARQTPPYDFVDRERCERSQEAIDKGLDIILKMQIEVNGQLTAWCAQHNKEDLSPAKARSYELPSISGGESVGVVRYLMESEDPRDEVKHAIHSAVAWYKESAIMGWEVVWEKDESRPRGMDRYVIEKEGAGPLWARFYDIETNKPMFVGRDGIVKESLNDIEHERRVGYSYLKDYATELLEIEYPQWEKKHGGKVN